MSDIDENMTLEQVQSVLNPKPIKTRKSVRTVIHKEPINSDSSDSDSDDELPKVKPKLVRQNGGNKKLATKQQKEEYEKSFIILCRYNNSRFKEQIKGLGFDLSPSHLQELKRNNPKELKELHESVSNAVNSVNIGKFLTGSVMTAIAFAEESSFKLSSNPLAKRFIDIDLRGLTQSLDHNDSFKTKLDILEIEYGGIGAVSPPMSIAIDIAFAAKEINDLNKFKRDHPKEYEELLNRQQQFHQQQLQTAQENKNGSQL
jgi:hypothetical protein